MMLYADLQKNVGMPLSDLCLISAHKQALWLCEGDSHVFKVSHEQQWHLHHAYDLNMHPVKRGCLHIECDVM